MTLDRAEIGHLNLKTTAEIEIVRFHNTGFRIFQRPNHARKHGGGHLHARCILIGCQRARFFNRET